MPARHASGLDLYLLCNKGKCENNHDRASICGVRGCNYTGYLKMIRYVSDVASTLAEFELRVSRIDSAARSRSAGTD